jgi:hypothetical protein
VVLGIGLDDPDNSPAIWRQGAALLASLRAEFTALGGIGGVELAPGPLNQPQSGRKPGYYRFA